MRNLMIAILLTIVTSVLAVIEARGGNRGSGDMSQFANEIAAKLVYRPDANILVRAQNCRLHIEYGALHVSFDLPLKDTTLAESETEDGIILTNSKMTRTLKGKGPEPYERIILRFERKTVKSMLKTFENAVTACGGEKTVAGIN